MVKLLSLGKSVSKLNNNDSPLFASCHTWYTRKFVEIFDTPENCRLFADEDGNLKKIKVLDFLVITGRVACKVQTDNGQTSKIEILFNEWDSTTWEKLISSWSDSIYFISQLFAGKIPAEMEEIYANNKTSFLADNIDQICILQNGKEVSKLNIFIVAVINKLIEHLEHEPFLSFLLRGRGKDEIMLEIRRFRSNLQKIHSNKLKKLSNEIETKINGFVEKTETEIAREQIENFLINLENHPNEVNASSYWNWWPDIQKIKYTIKADDLPASILKRLEPLPLGVLENKINYLLEEGYVHATKRAHSFGLGLG